MLVNHFVMASFNRDIHILFRMQVYGLLASLIFKKQIAGIIFIATLTPRHKSHTRSITRALLNKSDFG